MQSFAVSLHICPTGQNLDGSFPGSGQAGNVCPNAAVDNSHNATAKMKFLFIVLTSMAALYVKYIKLHCIKANNTILISFAENSLYLGIQEQKDPILNFAISEYALELKKSFVGKYTDKSAGMSKRIQMLLEKPRKIALIN